MRRDSRKYQDIRGLLIAANNADLLPAEYFRVLAGVLYLEHCYPELFANHNKTLYHYMTHGFRKHHWSEWFELWYDVNSPVRFAAETFDSIEEMRILLIDHPWVNELVHLEGQFGLRFHPVPNKL